MKMRVYDKARELNENSPNKAERLKEWLGWETIEPARDVRLPSRYVSR